MADGGMTLLREMGCSEAEFARWLPGATRHAAIDSCVDGGEVLHRVSVGIGAVEIRLLALPPRRIASITLPALRVAFRFIGMNEAQRDEFMTYFDHYTRRGGG